MKIKLALIFLVLSVVLVSGCTSQDDKTSSVSQANEPTAQPQNTKHTSSDLENKLTEKPWRPSTSFGTTGSRSRLVLKNGLFGNKWEFGSKTSFSSGNWELKDLTEKDVEDLASFGYSTSDVADKKLILHGWHINGETQDAESLVFLDKSEPWQLAPPPGYYIKDYNAETNELI